MSEFNNTGYQYSPKPPPRTTSKHAATTRMDDKYDYYPTSDKLDQSKSYITEPRTPRPSYIKEPHTPRTRDFIRQESKQYDAELEHMRADQELSPPTSGRNMSPTRVPPGGRDYRDIQEYPQKDPSPKYSSQGDSYELNNRSVHSAYGDNGDFQSTLSSRDRNDAGTLDHSTLSSRGHFDSGINNVTSPDIGAYNRTLLNRMKSNSSGLSLQVRNDLNRSMSHDMESHNRSTRLDSNQSILSQRSILSQHSNYANMNGDVNRSITFSTRDNVHQSFASESKVPSYKQNGVAQPVRDNVLSQSRRSLNVSRPSLHASRVTLYGNQDYGVYNSLVNLALASLLSLLVAIVGLQLIFRLTSNQRTGWVNNTSSVLTSNTSYENTLEVAVALCSFVVMLDICCFMVCAIQIYFAAKLLKVPQGEER